MIVCILQTGLAMRLITGLCVLCNLVVTTIAQIPFLGPNDLLVDDAAVPSGELKCVLFFLSLLNVFFSAVKLCVHHVT